MATNTQSWIPMMYLRSNGEMTCNPVRSREMHYCQGKTPPLACYQLRLKRSSLIIRTRRGVRQVSTPYPGSGLESFWNQSSIRTINPSMRYATVDLKKTTDQQIRSRGTYRVPETSVASPPEASVVLAFLPVRSRGRGPRCPSLVHGNSFGHAKINNPYP